MAGVPPLSAPLLWPLSFLSLHSVSLSLCLSVSPVSSQVNIYLSTALIDPSAATIQPVNQAAGLQHLVPTVGNLWAGAQQPPVTTTSGRPDTSRIPAGPGAAAEEASDIQPELLPPTQTSLWRCRLESLDASFQFVKACFFSHFNVVKKK